VAASAGWTFSHFTMRQRVGWVNLFGGVGILALELSASLA
jgi:hypothetical protein